MPSRRNPFRKLPHRPSDYGPPAAASPSGTSVNASTAESASNPAGSAPALPTVLEQFRGSRTRKPVHPRERALLAVVAAHLVFLPWALGTMHIWSQVTSLVLSTVSLVIALLPRRFVDEPTGTEYWMRPYPRLLRFPMFWLGLALLALIVVQALNPSWAFMTTGTEWWMTKIPHVTWLPSGVRIPFTFMEGGPWRTLIIYASAWLTVCAIWAGFTRRRSLQRLFLVVALNGVALSGFGLAERITGATKIFWSVTSSNPSFFSSFIYKNHAGAYLVLTIAVTCGLGAWYYVRGARRLEKSNPSGVFVFLATAIAVSVLVSYARGATLVMMGYLALVIAGFLFHQWRLPVAARRPIVAVAMLLVFGLFLRTGLQALNSDLAWDRLRSALSGKDISVEARTVADHASLEMLKDDWKLGVGAGGYPFLFTIYQQRYPAILDMDGHRVFWNHAHNDFLEIPIDLGVPGMLLIIGAFAYWLIALLRAYAWQNPLSATMIVGCLFVFGMSLGDFMFENPAVLITWCALWPACTRWAQLEEGKS